MTKLIMSIPNKGRIFAPTLALLQEAGIYTDGSDERLLSVETAMPNLTLMLVRASDIPRFVEGGAADLGITGLDMVVESGCNVARLLDLRFGSAKVVLAAPPDRSSPKDLRDGVKVATELPNLTSEYFRRIGIKPKIVEISGAAEIMPRMKVADVVVDIMSTGTTLQLQGLSVLDELLSSSAWLIGNKSSLEDAGKEDAMDFVKTILESTIAARSRRLVMMNVPDEKLEDVVKLIPAMGGPTIAKVESTPPMWEVYSVVESKSIFDVVKAVRSAGARDILVMRIEKVMP